MEDVEGVQDLLNEQPRHRLQGHINITLAIFEFRELVLDLSGQPSRELTVYLLESHLRVEDYRIPSVLLIVVLIPNESVHEGLCSIMRWREVDGLREMD